MLGAVRDQFGRDFNVIKGLANHPDAHASLFPADPWTVAEPEASRRSACGMARTGCTHDTPGRRAALDQDRDVQRVLSELEAAGLTTRSACGHTVQRDVLRGRRRRPRRAVRLLGRCACGERRDRGALGRARLRVAEPRQQAGLAGNDRRHERDVVEQRVAHASGRTTEGDVSLASPRLPTPAASS